MLTGFADGSGTGNYVSHGWNIVYVDDAWYHIDVTFDDPIGGGGSIINDYFLITGEEIAADHTW
jgi:transglutaminase/protease-like cytokinesis protein 3